MTYIEIKRVSTPKFYVKFRVQNREETVTRIVLKFENLQEKEEVYLVTSYRTLFLVMFILPQTPFSLVTLIW